MDNADATPYTEKFNETLRPAFFYARHGHVAVDSYSVHRLSEMLHASAMKHMGIASRREEMLFLGNAYQGESGELGNVIKKIARDGPNRELIKALEGEIADNYLYLQHICSLFGVDPTRTIVAKTDELYNVRQPEWAKEAITMAGGKPLDDGLTSPAD